MGGSLSNPERTFLGAFAVSCGVRNFERLDFIDRELDVERRHSVVDMLERGTLSVRHPGKELSVGK